MPLPIKPSFKILVVAFALAFTVPLALAAEQPPHQEQPLYKRFFDDLSRVGVGFAVLTRPEFIGSDKHQVDVFPMAQGVYNINPKNQIYLRGVELGYAHALGEHIQLGFAGTIGENREEDDDPRLAGMGDIDTAFEIGPWAKVRTGNGLSLKAAVLFDVAGAHDGYVGDLKLAQKLTEGKGPGFEIYAETKFGSGDFMDTYFSVSAAQALVGRPALNAGSGFYQSAVGMTFNYALPHDLFLRLDGGLQFLHGDAQKSSVTFDSTQARGMVALGYTF